LQHPSWIGSAMKADQARSHSLRPASLR
jgi:hypothetical protein